MNEQTGGVTDAPPSGYGYPHPIGLKWTPVMPDIEPSMQRAEVRNGSGAFNLAAVRRAMSRLIAKASETMLPSSLVTRMREGREWKQWVNTLKPNQFDDLSYASDEVKCNLFKTHVSLVEIEVHAKCNRICSFCPNVIVDRRKNNTLTDAELLDRVFEELGAIDYSRQIKIARYSEPLTNIPYLIERISTARRLVPNAQLAIVTNTDYLKPAVLNLLRESGLNRIYMSLYLKPDEKWSLGLAHKYNESLAEKLGAPIRTQHETPISLRCEFDYEGVELLSACIDFEEYGTDRGNTMEQYTHQKRVGPCREPFETFVIDYTGAVLPCCNLRSDFAQHQAFIVGDLSKPESSIFDIYAGQLAVWRSSMIGFDLKSDPCTTCRHREIPEGSLGQLASHTKKHLHQIGRGFLYKAPNNRPV